jgi:hypothetical protein
VEPFLKAVLAPLTEKGKKKGGRERRGKRRKEKRKEARVEGRRNNFHLMDS